MPRHLFALALAYGMFVSACASSAAPARVPDANASTLQSETPGELQSVPAPSQRPDAKRQETLPERQSRRLGRTWGWVAIGLGATAAAVALGTSTLMLEDLSERKSDCNASKVCSSDGLSANASLSLLATWNTTSWILTAVGAGAGAYLLLTNPSDDAAGVRVGIAPTGSGFGVNAGSSF